MVCGRPHTGSPSMTKEVLVPSIAGLPDGEGTGHWHVGHHGIENEPRKSQTWSSGVQHSEPI